MADFIYRRRLKSVKLAIAVGTVVGLYLAFFNFLHLWFPSYGKSLVPILQDLYPGYYPNWKGSFVLFGWGFLDPFLGTWLIGTLYNWLTSAGYGCKNWQNEN